MPQFAVPDPATVIQSLEHAVLDAEIPGVLSDPAPSAILGEVAALAPSLAWFGAAPLGATVHALPAAAAARDGVLEAIHRAAC